MLAIGMNSFFSYSIINTGILFPSRPLSSLRRSGGALMSGMEVPK
jgi:hypothetical protein